MYFIQIEHNLSDGSLGYCIVLYVLLSWPWSSPILKMTKLSENFIFPWRWTWTKDGWVFLFV